MQASVKIMDIDVDMMSNDVFVRKMNEYLTDDHLDVIMFASTKMLNKAMEDEEYRALLEKQTCFCRERRHFWQRIMSMLWRRETW